MDNNLVKAASARVMKARTELIMTRTFYGVLVGQVAPIATPQVPTMATDGKHHYYNPVFIDTLTQAELLGVQAHESEHDARRHHTRRGMRDPEEWNIATDYAINIDLVDQGFKLPKGALIDAKYRGMSAEDIYRTREIDRAEAERKRQQEQAAADEAGDDDEAEAEAEPEQGDDDGNSDDGQDGDQGDESDAAGDEDAEQDTDDGQDDDGQDGDDAGQGEGAGEAKGEADGDGAGEGSAGDGGEAQGDASGDTGQGDGESATDPRSSGDPGGCGEVLDAAPDVAGKVDEDAKWERVLRQAARLAAKRGDAPGHVAREIERADHPPQDWRETLRAYFDGGASTTETWNRPNRRFVGSGLFLPGRQRDGVNKVAFVIDTSGSVTYYPGALEAIQVETQAALDEGIIDQCTILYGDAVVTRVDEYRNGDEIEFDPKGGGGTDLRPMFQHIAEHIDDASLIVCFTDLEIGDPGPEPHCTTIWACVGFPQSVKEYLKNTPWNAPGIEIRPDV